MAESLGWSFTPTIGQNPMEYEDNWKFVKELENFTARMMKKQTNKQDIPGATQESCYLDVVQTLLDIYIYMEKNNFNIWPENCPC